jgi:hypothetical protein
MLGHGSATMTLDNYGHLFEDRLDGVGDAMDRASAARERRRGAHRFLLLPSVSRAGSRQISRSGSAQRFR